ncbi:hypothetical protein [Baekduia sp.]|uniref:hypothetical protein n=1 Tax=Baekduia sp. TaxID=2600305 RepID=UPI002E09AD77|nr:hypothetical protein [Baekduia sp.]
MPRSRSLLVVGLLAIVAAAVGGLAGARWLAGDSSRVMPPMPVTTPADDLSAVPRNLPPATLFVAPGGDDAGSCSAGAPCATFDAAYHRARPGQVVQLAGGDYRSQTLTPDPAKRGTGCESDGDLDACVILHPAPGAHVIVDDLDFGDNYKNAGPAGLAIVADRPRALTTVSTNFNQAREIALWGIDHRNIYVTGGRDIAIRGGRIGGQTSRDGLHPEIQGVYGSEPAIVPTRLTIENVLFHDINTTSPTAHVDCLQIESGTDLVIRGNQFVRCGSTGLRVSYGGGANENPPRHLLIEDNVFRSCLDTPVSACYYAAQVGIGHDVLVRHNTAEQEFQPSGDPQLASDVRYVNNLAPGVACESGVSYVGNRWVKGTCSSSDRTVAMSKIEAALRWPSAGRPAGARTPLAVG